MNIAGSRNNFQAHLAKYIMGNRLIYINQKRHYGK